MPSEGSSPALLALEVKAQAVYCLGSRDRCNTFDWGVVNDNARTSAAGSALPGAGAFSRAADDGVAGGPGAVLGGDQAGCQLGRRGLGDRRVAGGRDPLVSPAGGVAPNLPPAVPGRYLSFAERESIAVWQGQQAGGREIARRAARAPSTISREPRRNASTRTWRLDYRASVAQWHAERRARRPKVSKLAADERLREYVQDRLGGTVTAATFINRSGNTDRPVMKGHRESMIGAWHTRLGHPSALSAGAAPTCGPPASSST